MTQTAAVKLDLQFNFEYQQSESTAALESRTNEVSWSWDHDNCFRLTLRCSMMRWHCSPQPWLTSTCPRWSPWPPSAAPATTPGSTATLWSTTWRWWRSMVSLVVSSLMRTASELTLSWRLLSWRNTVLTRFNLWKMYNIEISIKWYSRLESGTTSRG